MGLYNLVSLAGIFVLLGFAWLISSDRRNVNYRVIIWGILLQLAFGAFVFLLPAGAKVFLFINDLIVTVLGSASAGAEFLFGRLAGFFSRVPSASDNNLLLGAHVHPLLFRCYEHGDKGLFLRVFKIDEGFGSRVPERGIQYIRRHRVSTDYKTLSQSNDPLGALYRFDRRDGDRFVECSRYIYFQP